MRTSLFCSALLLTLALTSCGGDNPRTEAILPLSGDAIAGAALFGEHCASCHEEGKFGAPDFRDGSPDGGDDRLYINTILDGIPLRMPSFNDDLSDQDVANLLANVRAQEASAQ